MIPLETTARIRQIADELGYVPNTMARGLRRASSRVVGALVRRIDDAFLAEVLQGIEDVLYGEGYSLFLATSHRDPEREKAIIRTMSERRVDGVLVCSSEVNQQHLQQLSRFGVPVVLINNMAPDEIAHTVCHDDVAGAYALAQYLIGLGHTRIAYLGNRRTGRITQDRLLGYRRALTQAGIVSRPDYIVAGPHGSSEGGAIATLELLRADPPPTAILCFNDIMAIGALHTLHESGRRVPEDCSVTGFDNIPLSRYVVPALTTFHQPRYELGVEAAEMMLRLLDRRRKSLNTAEIITLRGELVVRDSTAPPAPAGREP
jgi:DNA-binding LacI/PurR family transcriptional regulator